MEGVAVEADSVTGTTSEPEEVEPDTTGGTLENALELVRAGTLAGVELGTRSDASEEAALDRTLEKPDERLWETALSVAVAAMPDSSELRDAARLDRALEALAVMEAEVLAVAVPRVLDAADADDTAEDTRLAA